MFNIVERGAAYSRIRALTLAEAPVVGDGEEPVPAGREPTAGHS